MPRPARRPHDIPVAVTVGLPLVLVVSAIVAVWSLI